MLILTRNPGQKIMIGPDIEIVILEPRYPGRQVRIGIIAPTELPVHREEIYNIINLEQSWREELLKD